MLSAIADHKLLSLTLGRLNPLWGSRWLASEGAACRLFLYITPLLFNEVSYVFITKGGGGDCSNVLCKISNAFVYPQCLENNPKHSNNYLTR